VTVTYVLTMVQIRLWFVGSICRPFYSLPFRRKCRPKGVPTFTVVSRAQTRMAADRQCWRTTLVMTDGCHFSHLDAPLGLQHACSLCNHGARWVQWHSTSNRLFWIIWQISGAAPHEYRGRTLKIMLLSFQVHHDFRIYFILSKYLQTSLCAT
jgi:hypothetical protein